MGGSQNYLYLIRLDEADANMILLKFLGPVLAISSPGVVDDRFLTQEQAKNNNSIAAKSQVRCWFPAIGY